jgi:2-oxoglutarate dehydrogenase E2 component (dihydrolipoamide succinyltransferase)
LRSWARRYSNIQWIDVETVLIVIQARDGKLSIEDMAGGTYTISNGGVFGSMMGTPIINLPQTAVLGLHAIKDRAVVINGKIEIRPVSWFPFRENVSIS